MPIPSEFWQTSGAARLEAVLQRYDQQQLSAKMAVEYLAQLFPQSDTLNERQQRLVEQAHALMHDLSDGFTIERAEFEALLAAR